MAEGHENAFRHVSNSTIIENYEFQGELVNVGMDFDYGKSDVWLCECGEGFESKTSLVQHMSQTGVPKKKAPRNPVNNDSGGE